MANANGTMQVNSNAMAVSSHSLLCFGAAHAASTGMVVTLTARSTCMQKALAHPHGSRRRGTPRWRPWPFAFGLLSRPDAKIRHMPKPQPVPSSPHGLLALRCLQIMSVMSHFSPILHGQTDAVFQMPDLSTRLKQRSVQSFFSLLKFPCHGCLQMMPRDFRRLSNRIMGSGNAVWGCRRPCRGKQSRCLLWQVVVVSPTRNLEGGWGLRTLVGVGCVARCIEHTPLMLPACLLAQGISQSSIHP